MKIKNVILIIIGVLFLSLIIFFSKFVYLYTDYLWFKNLNYENIWTKILSTKILLAFIAGLIFFLISIVNFGVALLCSRKKAIYIRDNLWEIHTLGSVQPYLNYLFIGGCALLSILVASSVTLLWEDYLLFKYPTPFNIIDPLFKKDLSFYIFKLPLLKYIYGFIMFVLVFGAIITIGFYLFTRDIQWRGKDLLISKLPEIHLSILFALIFLTKSADYYLKRFLLLFSSSGIVYGAGWTDVHARLPVLKILGALSLLIAVLFLLNIIIRLKWQIVGSIILLILVSLVGGSIYPQVLQKFIVLPNEIEKERPFINWHIKFTRSAYDLERIKEKIFPAEGKLTPQIIKENIGTINNIRIWDPRPLLTTYTQLQGIRPYYKFIDVDIDRYHLKGKYQQVAISPRQLSSEDLPSKIWINECLTYTHGYGVVVNPVNESTEEGVPKFIVKDIPPKSEYSEYSDLKLNRPEIYYGELSNEYVVVKTRAQEFDYPAGDKNVFTNYEGEGGVRIGSFLNKLIFALRFSEIKILLSNDIHKDSRIMYYRQILTRLKKLAPFILYDSDPYIVVAEGRLFWIIDGFTTTSFYPYSQPTGNLGNYIRNAVKVIVDAYEGKVYFYIVDEKDPIILSYAKIFPGTFKPFKDMPASLKKHIRYPESIFSIQTQKYALFHMTDTQVFYNQENLWEIPKEVFQDDQIEVKPYYITMRLPQEKKEEFILMLPFTPVKKDNLSAWMMARCDGENYGELIVYKFPRGKLIYGPLQIEARIDQNPEISKQLSLWGQRGSRIIRGNLLVIPIEDTLIYVEPLYLEAEKGKIPELKRIILAYENRITMQENIDKAFNKIFGEIEEKEKLKEIPFKEEKTSKKLKKIDLKDLIKQANSHYQKARERQKAGDWAGYGEELRKLGEVLERLREFAP